MNSNTNLVYIFFVNFSTLQTNFSGIPSLRFRFTFPHIVVERKFLNIQKNYIEFYMEVSIVNNS